jgi:alkylation response protein AidB-like acyl-CoA dehydrogenase
MTAARSTLTQARGGAPPQAAGAGSDATAARVTELFAEELRPQAPAWERDGGLPGPVFRRLAEVGAWAGRWPDRGRGPGDVALGAHTVREMALSSVGACIAVGTHQEVFFRALARSPWGREEGWDQAIGGERVGAFAVTERGGGSTPGACRTSAQRSDRGWVLNGHKHYVSNVPAATDLIVFARTSKIRDLSDFTVFLVPKSAAGVALTRHDLVGATASGTFMVDLVEVEVDGARRVGATGSGLPLLFAFLRGERMAAASGSLAAAELCFETALAWCDRRTVHGRRLRQHQAVGHRLAALESQIAAGRAFLADRIEIAQGERMSSAQAAQAKYVLGRLAWSVADEAMQLLAGHGYTEEIGFARLWRDVRIGRIGGGTDEVQLELVSQGMRPGVLGDHPLVLATAAMAEAER